MSFNTVPFNPFPPGTEKQGGGGSPYVLPIAGVETLGGVMIGDGLSINAETGELTNNNPTPYTPPAYSTSEVNTGEKWLDGSDIFVKSFKFTSFDVGINNLGVVATDINEILKCEGVLVKTINNVDYYLPLSRYDNASNYNQVYIGDNIILSIADADFASSTYRLCLIVHFTKTPPTP